MFNFSAGHANKYFMDFPNSVLFFKLHKKLLSSSYWQTFFNVSAKYQHLHLEGKISTFEFLCNQNAGFCCQLVFGMRIYSLDLAKAYGCNSTIDRAGGIWGPSSLIILPPKLYTSIPPLISGTIESDPILLIFLFSSWKVQWIKGMGGAPGVLLLDIRNLNPYRIVQPIISSHSSWHFIIGYSSSGHLTIPSHSLLYLFLSFSSFLSFFSSLQLL